MIYFLSLCTKCFYHYNNDWLALCCASVWDHPSYWQLTHYTQNYPWHVFSPTPEHQGSAITHQVYHFWHWTSLISACREMCSTALHRPVLREGGNVSKLPYALSSLFYFILGLLLWRCPLYFQFIEMEVHEASARLLCITNMSGSTESTQRWKICSMITLVLCSFLKTEVCHFLRNKFY